MNRAHQQRSVAVVLTAALLAVLAVVAGPHIGHRSHRASATSVVASATAPVAAHHAPKHTNAVDQLHLDLASTLASPWAPRLASGIDDATAPAVSAQTSALTAHDSRAPPTA